MKTLFSLAGFALVAVVPASAFAASYHYINLQGNVVTIEAQNASQALQTVQASNDALHTGVKLDQGVLKTGESFGIHYRYVDTTGNIKDVVAASDDAAFLLATDRAADSGVIRVGPAY